MPLEQDPGKAKLRYKHTDGITRNTKTRSPGWGRLTQILDRDNRGAVKGDCLVTWREGK